MLEHGDAGFILAHLALWFHERVEYIDNWTRDDWGWAVRDIRNSTTVSNHASGTAIDLNATKHPLGAVGTFTPAQAKRIRKRLKRVYPEIRWGGDYKNRKDEMHFEIVGTPEQVKKRAKALKNTYRGRRIRKANPS